MRIKRAQPRSVEEGQLYQNLKLQNYTWQKQLLRKQCALKDNNTNRQNCALQHVDLSQRLGSKDTTAAERSTLIKARGGDEDSKFESTVLSPISLAEARKLSTSREILLWMTPSEAPKALQASECSELLDPMRASCWIFAQH